MVFEIPSDFRSFMADVVAQLDEFDPVPCDGEEAFRSEIGNGGRIQQGAERGDDIYKFHYITADGLYRWELELRERAIRSIAEDMLIEIEGTRFDVERTKRRPLEGDPLLVWGDCSDDALRIRGTRALIEALDALHDEAAAKPRLFRLWSAADDQIAGVVWEGRCALYVVQSIDGYAASVDRSVGDRSLVESFPVEDHDGRRFEVSQANCIPWDRARNAILSFVDHGHLGPEIAVENQVPTLLLYMGDVDRKAALENREKPPKRLKETSLGRPTTQSVPIPHPIEHDEPTQPVEVDAALDPVQLTAWAKRLLEVLHQRQLIELGEGAASGGNINLDELTYQLGGLLQAHGLEAEHSIETADWLANEIGRTRGVHKLFATGGDLQIAIRRSRES